jgi:hypothetical protein
MNGFSFFRVENSVKITTRTTFGYNFFQDHVLHVSY